MSKSRTVCLSEYYKTPWWVQRSRAYREKIGKCERCGETEGLHAHHRRYRFYREQDSDMECLCRHCHITEVHQHKDEDDMLDMDFNHQNNTGRLLHLIDEALEKKNQKQKTRDYLGGSRLGVECQRSLQYEFFNAPKDEGKNFNGRTLRIFELGHVLEDMIIGWLRGAGLDVRNQKESGDQFGFVTGKGHIRGHIDGVILDGPPELGPYPRLLEIKTANGKKWREMDKHKIKKANWTYYIQCQLYMAYMDLTDHPALFTAVNKDTCELYFEDVPFDPGAAQDASDRGVRIIEASLAGELLPRVTADPSFYQCKFCSWSDRCWEK